MITHILCGRCQGVRAHLHLKYQTVNPKPLNPKPSNSCLLDFLLSSILVDAQDVIERRLHDINLKPYTPPNPMA